MLLNALWLINTAILNMYLRAEREKTIGRLGVLTPRVYGDTQVPVQKINIRRESAALLRERRTWLFKKFQTQTPRRCEAEVLSAGGWRLRDRTTSLPSSRPAAWWTSGRNLRRGLHIQTSRRRLQVRTWPPDQRQSQCGGERTTSWG